MGKNKGVRGGYNDLIESYVASGLANQSINNNIDNGYIPLPDSMKSSTLLEQIGKDRQWSEEQINHDIEIMDNNRLYYIRDLRELSNNSWKKIGLLPIVKDILKKSLLNKDDKKKKKKQEKKKKKLGTPSRFFPEHEINQDPETIRNTLSNLSITSSPLYSNNNILVNERKKSVSFSEDDSLVQNDKEDSTSSSSSSSDVDTIKSLTKEKRKVFTGRPIEAISGTRIRVRTNDGDVFEADRYCPHKKVDLVSWGQVVGRSVICTKHNWNLCLDATLSKKGKNINACKINDW